jgi:hypothetical protein
LDSSIIQGPFSVAPCQALISRFATFASLYPCRWASCTSPASCAAARCARTSWCTSPATTTRSNASKGPRSPASSGEGAASARVCERAKLRCGQSTFVKGYGQELPARAVLTNSGACSAGYLVPPPSQPPSPVSDFGERIRGRWWIHTLGGHPTLHAAPPLCTKRTPPARLAYASPPLPPQVAREDGHGGGGVGRSAVDAGGTHGGTGASQRDPTLTLTQAGGTHGGTGASQRDPTLTLTQAGGTHGGTGASQRVSSRNAEGCAAGVAASRLEPGTRAPHATPRRSGRKQGPLVGEETPGAL